MPQGLKSINEEPHENLCLLGALITTTAPSINQDRRYFIGESDARIIIGADEMALIRLWTEERPDCEVTESVMKKDCERSSPMPKACAILVTAITIGDFGTEFSSLELFVHGEE